MNAIFRSGDSPELNFVLAALCCGAVTLALPQSAKAQGGGVQWHPQVSPNTPGNGAIVGGPGDAPQPGSPLYVCRAAVQGGTHPGKWVGGNCDVPFGGKEVVTKVYEVAYGPGEWRPFTGKTSELVQTGNESDGTPLYSCRVQYKNHGYQPGKISIDSCHIPYDGKEKVVHSGFEALYIAGGNGPYVAAAGGSPHSGAAPAQAQAHSSGGGLFGKLVANAQYQQAKQNGASASELEAIKQSAGEDNGVPDNTNANVDRAQRTPPRSGYLPPCRMEDHDAHLENGYWVGPNCFKEPDDGHYVSDEEAMKQQQELRAKQNSQGDQERRADFIESHSCMTTLGADKANELTADCEKVTSGSHKGCNIQENTCDEIRKATQKGCWDAGTTGPDWCLTRYN